MRLIYSAAAARALREAALRYALARRGRRGLDLPMIVKLETPQRIARGGRLPMQRIALLLVILALATFAKSAGAAPAEKGSLCVCTAAGTPGIWAAIN